MRSWVPKNDNASQKNMKRNILKKILPILFSCILVSALLCAYYGFVIKPGIDSDRENLKILQDVMNSNLHSVYVAERDLEAGEVISEDDVYEETQYISNTSGLFTANDFGKLLTVDIPAGETMSNRTLAEFNKNERLVEYSCFRLSSKMTDGLYIDVRIRFQNSEDYVVLPKKQLQSVDLQNSSCFLDVDENDIQMMASAIADASEYGAHLYATLYSNSAQEASVVDYVPRFSNPALFPELYTKENVLLRQQLVERITGVSTPGYTDGADISGIEIGDNGNIIDGNFTDGAEIQASEVGNDNEKGKEKK